jgi:hypothetical protein
MTLCALLLLEYNPHHRWILPIQNIIVVATCIYILSRGGLLSPLDISIKSFFSFCLLSSPTLVICQIGNSNL